MDKSDKRLPFILTLGVILADQFTKWLITVLIPAGGIGASFMGDFLRIIHARNTAIAFSIGTSMPQVLNASDLKYGDILAPAQAADAIRACGFEEVVLGNEHILDYGEQGALETVNALTARSILCEGVNSGASVQNRVLQLNGCGIAVLSYSDALTAKGKNTLATQPALLKPFDAETVKKDIQIARSQGARCVIVCMYWGKADTSSVTNSLKQTAHSLAEMGADVILGTRPERVLPMEIVTTIDENGKSRETFVAYSLGTLLTESRDGFSISGALLHLNIRCDEAGRIHFDSAEYTPTYIWRQNVNGNLQYRIVSSADAVPEGMSEQQQDVMKRALNRIQTALQNSPVRIREAK